MRFDLDAFCRTLAENAPDAIIFADADGAIRFWNKGAAQIFGFTAEEALGRSLDIIIPEKLRERHWQGYRAVMQSGQSRYGAGDLLAVPGLRKDGSRVSLEFTILPFRGPDGRIEGIAAILRDVTARFEEMQKLRKELAATSRQAD
jgi:PAS domain S-box-containing protein